MSNSSLLRDLYQVLDKHGLSCKTLENGTVLVVLDESEEPTIQMHLPHSKETSYEAV